MVYGRYIDILTMAMIIKCYKPTYNWRAPGDPGRKSQTDRKGSDASRWIV